jgi:hypothetical protein
MATNQYAPAPAINLAAPMSRAAPQGRMDVQGGYGQAADSQNGMNIQNNQATPGNAVDPKNKVSSAIPTVGMPLSTNQPGRGTGGPLMPGQPTGLIGSKMLTR